jgi:SAM-dependent methyltransferase
MTNTAHDPDTLRFYAENAPVYVASGANGTSRHLASFLSLLPPAAHILDLGCGGGRDAQVLIAAGHRVDPTDGSPAIAAKAQDLLGITVRVMRFEDLDAQGLYDAVWANASLLHVPRPALPGVLARVRAALKPGGLHMASYKGGGQEGRDSHGRYFNYLSAAELRAVYDASGKWEVLSLLDYTGGGYDPGVQGPWTAIFARRVD